MNQGWKISQKKNKPHIFNIIKIENNDFIIILDHANLNDMMPTTNYCSNPTEKFLGGSITHIKSP